MIIKVRNENQWLYYDYVDEVKLEETNEEGKPVVVNRMFVFQKNNSKTIVIELNGSVAYFLNDNGKTIERIN